MPNKKPAPRLMPSSGRSAAIERQKRAERLERQQAENVSRPAVSEHRVNTSGVGTANPPNAILFSVPFLDAPMMTYGALIVKDASNSNWDTPFAQAAIRDYVQNESGHYIGAVMSYRITMQWLGLPEEMPETYPEVGIQHMLTFAALGFKPLAASEDVAPYTVDLF